MQVPPCVFAAQRHHVGHQSVKQKNSPAKEKIKNFGVGLALRDLEYPNTHLTSTSRCDVAPAQGTGQRAMMAQAFSAAAAEEMKALGNCWQLRNIQGQKRLEEAVARALKHICRRAERSCVLKALRHTVVQRAKDVAEAARLSDEEMQLEAEIASLQRQVDASSERLKALDHLEANAHQLASPKADTLKELIQQIEAELPNFSGMEVDSGLDIFLESLGLVKAWLQRTLGQLQEAREELAEKEKAAASCAFLHLPDEAPNGQSALARLP